MSGPRIVSGRIGTPGERRLALVMQDGAEREIAAVRARAQGWAKGAAGVTVGILGFGLIKGRTDVGVLATTPGIAVGILLLAALSLGGLAAYLFVRAAYGRPAAVRLTTLESLVEAQHLEAARSTRALRVGFAATATALSLLVAGVAVTWYGPAADGPRTVVYVEPNRSLCGHVEKVFEGELLLRTSAGVVPVKLDSVIALGAVDVCP